MRKLLTKVTDLFSGKDNSSKNENLPKPQQATNPNESPVIKRTIAPSTKHIENILDTKIENAAKSVANAKDQNEFMKNKREYFLLFDRNDREKVLKVTNEEDYEQFPEKWKILHKTIESSKSKFTDAFGTTSKNLVINPLKSKDFIDNVRYILSKKEYTGEIKQTEINTQIQAEINKLYNKNGTIRRVTY